MTDASLIYEIDSSKARSAATDLAKLQAASAKLAADFSKTDKALRDSSGRFQSSQKVVAQYGDEVRRLAAEFNPALNAVYKFQEAETRMNRAVALGVLTLDQKNIELAKVKTSLANATGAQAKFAQSAQMSSYHVANLGYQLNDIGMMMALGQSPFTLMLQQGPQVSQIFGQMAAQGQKLGPTLIAALKNLVNPMTAITLVAIGGAAALVQWGMSAFGAGEKTKTLSENIDILKQSVTEVNTVSKNYSADGLTQMRDKYGEINAELLSMIELQRKQAIDTAMLNAKNAIGELQTSLSGLKASLAEYDNFSKAALSDPSWAINASAAADDLMSKFGLTVDEAKKVRDALIDASRAGSFEDQAMALARVNELLGKSSLSGGELAKSALDAYFAMKELAKSAPEANWMNAAINGVAALGVAIRARIAEAAKLSAETAASIPSGREGRLATLNANMGGRGLPAATYGIPDPVSTGGGGGSGAGGQDRLDTLKKQFLTEREQAMQQYALDQAALQSAFDQKLLTEQQYLMQRQQMNRDYYAEAYNINQNAQSQTLSDLAADFGQMYQLAGNSYDGLLRAQKAFAAASALINAYQAASQALAQPGITAMQKIINAGKVLAAGLGFVSAIKGGGNAKGGGGGASAATSAASAATAATAVEKQIYVKLDGPDWMVDMASSVLSQIYEQSRDGRVVISRAGR